jgi:hypothetical protein
MTVPGNCRAAIQHHPTARVECCRSPASPFSAGALRHADLSFLRRAGSERFNLVPHRCSTSRIVETADGVRRACGPDRGTRGYARRKRGKFLPHETGVKLFIRLAEIYAQDVGTLDQGWGVRLGLPPSGGSAFPRHRFLCPVRMERELIRHPKSALGLTASPGGALWFPCSNSREDLRIGGPLARDVPGAAQTAAGARE